MKQVNKDRCMIVIMVLLMGTVLLIGFLTLNNEIPVITIFPLMPNTMDYPLGAF